MRMQPILYMHCYTVTYPFRRVYESYERGDITRSQYIRATNYLHALHTQDYDRAFRISRPEEYAQ